jgi:hypothetical protein
MRYETTLVLEYNFQGSGILEIGLSRDRGSVFPRDFQLRVITLSRKEMGL